MKKIIAATVLALSVLGGIGAVSATPTDQDPAKKFFEDLRRNGG